MPRPTELHTPEDIDAVLAASHRGPVFVLKHSATCPVSAFGRHQFGKLEDDADAPLYLVVVQHARAASNHLAAALGVRHETPQALLLHGGEAVGVWNHTAIRGGALREAIATLGAQ
jgi:bacillithiol system protein YtxJ